MNEYTLYTDGGSRGNPGPAGIGFVINRGDERICHGGAFIGEATNNVAEYKALIWGLENAQQLHIEELIVHADSELLIKQLKGEYKVKNAGLRPLFLEALTQSKVFKSCKFVHVYREDNEEADALANEAMDQQSEVGESSLPFVAPKDLFDFTQDTPVTKTAGEEASAVSSDLAGIYTLTVKDHFDAAHYLYDYPGECRNLHGHTWDIEVSVESTQLCELGMVYDFALLKKDLKGVLDRYDHKHLNEITPFDSISPTAENLARIIFEELSKVIVQEGVTVVEVAVWESPIAKLSYRLR